MPIIPHRLPDLLRHFAKNPSEARWMSSWLRLRNQSPISAALPWLPFRITAMLAREITSQSIVFEYGGGGSTKWFLQRGVRQVTTVEHDAEWLKVLGSALTPSIRHQMIPVDLAERGGRSYVEAIRDYPDESIDVVVVDGRHRVDCAEEAAAKIRRGGILIFDDIDRERYQDVFRILANWPATRVDGLCPGKSDLGHVAVFRKL